MFWGLILEPGKRYTQNVKVPFHISMAAMDLGHPGTSQVLCVFEGRNYLLCTLDNQMAMQCPLDLNFEVGTKVTFAINGQSRIHLTGYLTGMDEFDDDLEDLENAAGKSKKRVKEANDGPPKKKSKNQESTGTTLDLLANILDEDEDEDSDFTLSKLEDLDSDDEDDSVEQQQDDEGAEEEDDSDENAAGEVEDEDEEDDDDDDEEEDEAESGDEDTSSLSTEEDEEEEEEVVVTKPTQNGVSKKNLKPVKEQKTPKQDKKTVNNEKQKPNEKTPKTSEKKPKKTVLKGGVIVEDLKEGNGDLAKPGKLLNVYYEGRLKDNNKLFDSSTKGPGFKFRLGKEEVIKGWDFGIAGMKVGGKRRITCPPSVAYGPKGSPPAIPPNATLVFEVELKKVN